MYRDQGPVGVREPYPSGPHGVSRSADVAPRAPDVLPPPVEIDRTKVCPLLLKVFTKQGGHHRVEDYQNLKALQSSEVEIYTWPDATLRELMDLVKEVQPPARRPNARLSFAFVYPDRRGRNVMRVVGETHSTRPGPDDNKTLKFLSFQTGDILDVAIF